MIEIDIVLLTVLFCNCLLFSNRPLADLQLPALKRYQVQYKVFVGLVWLTSNDMFGSSNFWDKSPSWFLKNLKLLLFYLGNFKIFKNAHGQFIPNRPLKHVSTSTNWIRQRRLNFLLYGSDRHQFSAIKIIILISHINIFLFIIFF